MTLDDIRGTRRVIEEPVSLGMLRAFIEEISKWPWGESGVRVSTEKGLTIIATRQKELLVIEKQDEQEQGIDLAHQLFHGPPREFQTVCESGTIHWHIIA